jgi:hypothetical protein
LGTLVAVLAFFRLAIAFGSVWVDVVLAALGLITFMLPENMHMQWNANFTLGHRVAGGVIIAIAVVSFVLTKAALSKLPKTA